MLLLVRQYNAMYNNISFLYKGKKYIHCSFMYFDEAEPKIDYTYINNYRSTQITIFIIHVVSTSSTRVMCFMYNQDQRWHKISLLS